MCYDGAVMKPETPPLGPQLQIEIDDQTARGAYANLALIAHSETEFLLDFLFIQPHAPKARVLSRIITSPAHLKRLIAALKDNLEKYEARFGAVELAEDAAAKPSTYYQ